MLLFVPTLFAFFAANAVTGAPLRKRDVTIDPVATAEAQKFDATATRALTGTTITTSDGRCLSVDPASGDFRENLTPINVVKCDGSKNQTWDVITAGVHNNVPGQALIVSSLTNACLNFDDRRAPGNQVLLFACGGRADGSGQVQNGQLFPFTTGNNGPQALLPQNANNKTCLTVINNLVDQTACNGAASATGLELFSFGGSSTSTQVTSTADTLAVTTTEADSSSTAASSSTTDIAECSSATVTQTVTVTVSDSSTTSTTSKANVALAATTTASALTTTAAALTTTASNTATTTTPIKVSGAGGTLNPSAVAEAQPKDTTATFAARGVQLKSSSGQCLSIDATEGDFRENLIPIRSKPCDGSEGQKFDFITKGVHNNQAGQTLIVSSLTNGCMNFDPRRAAGDQVILFSCGGRADGGGLVTNSQLFPFTNANLAAPYALTPSNGQGVCLTVGANGRLTNANCNTANPTSDELFTIVA